MVAVIESAFLAALVASIGGATATRPAGFLAIRAVLLSAKIPTTNEEDAPAIRATQLIQRDFVFHPHRGRRESGRPGLLALSSRPSSFIRLTEDPELELWVLTLPAAAALYPGTAALANSPSIPTLATPRPSDFRGS